MDGCLGGRTQAATAWLKNITEYIKSIDAHEHMIDNSYAQSPGTEREDKLDTISFTTTHSYVSTDIAGSLASYSVRAIILILWISSGFAEY
jgi:predicted TIM-barrel fold metal-dependent hydrolase